MIESKLRNDLPRGLGDVDGEGTEELSAKLAERLDRKKGEAGEIDVGVEGGDAYSLVPRLDVGDPGGESEGDVEGGDVY